MSTSESNFEGIRVVDWLMNSLVERGISQVFMVAGGAAMYLNDAAGFHPGLNITPVLHEQAAAIAAETYFKSSGRLALCLVTAGPGSTNAITGVVGGWLDSTPMLIISGQAKTSDLKRDSGVRQRGVQEVDIVSMVKSVTKAAVLLDDAQMVGIELDRLLGLATSGRPGPVWIDIPLDIQASRINPDSLKRFEADDSYLSHLVSGDNLVREVEIAWSALATASTPLVLVGAGVRLSGAEHATLQFIENSGIPVLATWPAQGVVGDDHPLYIGRPGSLAPRGANFALQNADCILTIGARLDLVTTGYDPKDFGRNANKFVVDIDQNELAKLEGLIGRGICTDARMFVEELNKIAHYLGSEPVERWRERCSDWRDRYPIVSKEVQMAANHGCVSTYMLADAISNLLEPDDVLVPCSSGLGIEVFQLALRLHTGQRVISTTALGGMGFGPPSAIGACIGADERRTICIDGDGGLQLNVQELETIRRLQLPIKMFILNNDGYASIRSSQNRWFGRVVGADEKSGMTLPALKALASAYGLPYVRINPELNLVDQLIQVLSGPGPVLCEVPSPPDEPREPVQTSVAKPDGGMKSRPLEDLAPLLTRDELAANLPAGTRIEP